MSLAKYISSLALGLSLTACASSNNYIGKNERRQMESMYHEKVVAFRVCDSHGCSEWETPDGTPYLVQSPSLHYVPQLPQSVAKPLSSNLLPPPRHIQSYSQSSKELPKAQVPSPKSSLESKVDDEECPDGNCKVPGK